GPSVFNQCGTASLPAIFRMLKLPVMVLLLLTSVASAQSVQTIDSEAQLASILCRNPAEEAANELLDKNSQFVNVVLWNSLVNCASSGHQQQSPERSIQIYKLSLRIAERINKPELLATTYYHLGRTYSVLSDFENAIQAYEKSKNIFEQAGIESNLIYVLADLGGLYLVKEDYEKAQSYSEQSLAIAGDTKSTSTKESLAPLEYGKVRSLLTLGEIDLRHGNHDDALKKLREALTLCERLNETGSSYRLQMADVLI